MVGESIFVAGPLILKLDFGYDTLSAALFLSFIAFLVVPSSFLINKYFKEIQERKMILILILTCAFCSLMLISFSFFKMSLERYVLFSAVFYVAANVCESFTSALLAKIYPPNLAKIGLCNAGFTIIFSTTGGKLTGAALVTFLALLGNGKNIENTIFGLYLFVFAVLSYAIYSKYSELRVKAIARIIQRKTAH